MPASPNAADFVLTPYRLYRAFGEARDRGDGWFAVPLRRSPLALVVRLTDDVPNERAAWEFRGLFRGAGEVRLRPAGAGTLIEGYEDVGIPRALGLGRLVERLFLESRFRRVWASGWRRLRVEGEPAHQPAQPRVPAPM